MTLAALTRSDPARLALFLDFDGCLVDLAARPQDVAVPRTLPGLLHRLARRSGGAVALVSGRPVAELRRFLPGLDLPVYGSHGAEAARGRGGRIARLPVDRAALAAALAAARAATAAWPGVLVEAKPTGLALHSRAAPARAAALADLAAALLRDLPGFHLHAGKHVIELRPDAAGKDRALARALAAPPFRGRRPVMAGDDRTDEPAFALVNARGGLSIKIGAGPTCARARLGSPAALRRVLLGLAAGGRGAGQGGAA